MSRATVSGLALLAVMTTACVDEKIVFQDRKLFEEPPASAMGFLGYTDVDEKLTVCGNCHVGQQAGWETTGHADAWAGLQSSDHAQAFCEGCHTVNELGNSETEPGGYLAFADERYHDVQCESCHGPGLDHVTNPDATQPLAPMTVGLDMETGCGECHSGAHHPFVEQWAQSAHGILASGSYAGTRDGCNQCHNGKVALRVKYGETANYLEEDEAVIPITCGVCHDPHGSDFSANLRASISEPSEANLCVTCHSRVGTPVPWSYRGPHAAQGLLVLGNNVGWIPPGFDYDSTSMASSHGTEANPKLCATCHVGQFNVTDANGDAFTSVGHLFEATPCIDPQTGLPVPGPCDVSQENFQSCAGGACHANPDVSRLAFNSLKGEINFLLDQLWNDRDGDQTLDPHPEDTGVLARALAKVGPTEFDPASAKVTIAKGAIWNGLLAYTRDRPVWSDFAIKGIGGHIGAHKSSGDGVHNPFLLKALLISSIEAVQDRYDVATSPEFVQMKESAGF